MQTTTMPRHPAKYTDLRRARVWEYVRVRAIFGPYIERGLPLEEIYPLADAQGA